MKKFLLILLLATPVLAEVKLCHESADARRCPIPSGVFVMPDTKPPFNTPVQFSRQYTHAGVVLWVFKRAGATTPCTPTQLADKYIGRVCRASMGDEIFQSARFVVVAP